MNICDTKGDAYMHHVFCALTQVLKSCYSLLTVVLKPLYQAAPEKIMRSIDNINESMEDMDDIEKTYLYILLDEIAKTKSQVSHKLNVI